MRGQQIARWATDPDKKGEEVTEQAAGLSEELMIHLNLSEIKARGLWCGRVGVREQRGRQGGKILGNRLKLKLPIISTKPRIWDAETDGVMRMEK